MAANGTRSAGQNRLLLQKKDSKSSLEGEAVVKKEARSDKKLRFHPGKASKSSAEETSEVRPRLAADKLFEPEK